jgi:DHA1 family bicyclomycin/chloramphenicol resistance-like MFS transporter
MLWLIRAALGIEIMISGLFALIIWQNLLPDWAYFSAFLIFMTSVFFMVGLTLGNLNAIAMEPMGHMAGMAASAISATATVLGIGIAAPIGLAFDGTPLPLTTSVFVLIVTAFGLMQRIKKEPVYIHGSSSK